MFLTLLIVTFLVSLLVCFIVAKLFSQSIDKILRRIISEELSEAWQRYIMFAIYVVGISGGVRIWELEKYINPQVGPDGNPALVLNSERWVLEVYRTIIETLQSVAWMLLVFFLATLIAFVVVKAIEMGQARKRTSSASDDE